MPIDDHLVNLWESSGARTRGVSLKHFQTNEIDTSVPCPPRIGFCTAIKGKERFPNLIKSLDHNIAIYNKKWRKDHYRPDVKFIILGYGEPDLEAEMLKHFQKEMESGLVIVANTEAEHFEYAAAKNAAAQVAMDYAHCDVICNVDGDNLFGAGGHWHYGTEDTPDFITFLQKTFRYNRNSIARPVDMEGEEFFARPVKRGLGGRIAISADRFRWIRGYDEVNYPHWGGDDMDFMHRALATYPLVNTDTIKLISINDPLIYGDVLEHERKDRWRNLPEEVQGPIESIEASSAYRWENPEARNDFMAQELIRHLPYTGTAPSIFTNPDGWKTSSARITVYDSRKNCFKQEVIDLTPLPPLTERQRAIESTAQRKGKLDKTQHKRHLDFIRQQLESLPEYYIKAILMEALQRRKFSGHEPVERALGSLVWQLSDPAVLKRTLIHYDEYRKLCDQYLPSQEQGKDETRETDSFVKRHAKPSLASAQRSR